MTDITIEQVLRAREVLDANEVPPDATQWMIDYLSCGHFVAIPINAPDKQPHLVYEDAPLHKCCVEALESKWLDNASA